MVTTDNDVQGMLNKDNDIQQCASTVNSGQQYTLHVYGKFVPVYYLWSLRVAIFDQIIKTN